MSGSPSAKLLVRDSPSVGEGLAVGETVGEGLAVGETDGEGLAVGETVGVGVDVDDSVPRTLNAPLSSTPATLLTFTFACTKPR